MHEFWIYSGAVNGLLLLFISICIVTLEINGDDTVDKNSFDIILHQHVSPCIFEYIINVYFNSKKQTMKLERIICDIPLSPIHLRNRDASSVMLAGSQAWDWGFLTHHALFIVQSNRVCKMRITQHEENRGEGTEGRRGGEGRKARGAKVRDGVEEEEIEGEEKGAR